MLAADDEGASAKAGATRASDSDGGKMLNVSFTFRCLMMK